MIAELTPLEADMPMAPPAWAKRAIYVCSLCRDSGTVFVQKRGKPGAPVIFRCMCNRGRSDPRAFPLWQFSYDTEFEVMG